jgi:hypothetical protein
MPRTMHRRWSKEETNILISNYLNLSNKDLSKLLDLPVVSIQSRLETLKLSRSGIRFRVDGLNETYFDNWSSNMAYVLGFTMADGCVYSNEYRFGYGVASKDRCILEYIGGQFNYSNIIDTVEYRKGVPHNTSRLRISSKHMIKSLERYNIIQRKTGKERLPEIPDEYKFDYLRGLFDGDGCVYIVTPSCHQVRFDISSASQEFLLDIQTKIGMNFGTVYKKQANCYNWSIYKQSDIDVIKHYMYQNDDFCLLRKKEKFRW